MEVGAGLEGRGGAKGRALREGAVAWGTDSKHTLDNSVGTRESRGCEGGWGREQVGSKETEQALTPQAKPTTQNTEPQFSIATPAPNAPTP